MPHVDNGGLQAHSIGELYPWTIAGRGVNPVKWQAQNLLTGCKGPIRPDYDRAEFDAILGIRMGDQHEGFYFRRDH